MKIFNWVHHKFYQKDSAKKDHHGQIINCKDNADRKALLENDKNELWGGAILAIGTLGVDPMMSNYNAFNPYEPDEYEDEEDYCVEDEKEYSYSNDDDNGSGIADENEELSPLILSAHHEIVDTDNKHHEISSDLSQLASNKKERITLADLFSADADIIIITDNNATKSTTPFPVSSCLPTTRNNGMSFAKKLVGDQGRRRRSRHPINKLHQMMTKMLRRKIHPEMEGKKTHNIIKSNSSLTTN